jgi:hypothetical protein
MTDVQAQLHHLIEKHHPFSGVVRAKEEKSKDAKVEKGKKNCALQSLILHRKVCNHPYFIEDLESL